MPSLMLFRYDVRSCQMRKLEARVNFAMEIEILYAVDLTKDVKSKKCLLFIL